MMPLKSSLDRLSKYLPEGGTFDCPASANRGDIGEVVRLQPFDVFAVFEQVSPGVFRVHQMDERAAQAAPAEVVIRAQLFGRHFLRPCQNLVIRPVAVAKQQFRYLHVGRFLTRWS